MSYVPRFDWKALATTRGDRPDGVVAYRYHEDLALAVNVALAAARPLLLSGKPGTGKSTLAADVAWKLGRRFYADSVTSKTEGRDLQWRFDAVERLSYATSSKENLPEPRKFITPGVLWWAFQPNTAKHQGNRKPAERKWGDEGEHAVVLVDEIDKAEPDVPNDLLNVLDQRAFHVPETDTRVSAEGREVLIVITTNGERDLPPAFVRRCVTYELPMPKEAELEEIARLHFKGMNPSLVTEVRKLFEELGGKAESQKLRAPSTAELIDALRACAGLKIESELDEKWKEIALASMWKHGKLKDEPGKK
jgi:MoxR-like ATPase